MSLPDLLTFLCFALARRIVNLFSVLAGNGRFLIARWRKKMTTRKHDCFFGLCYKCNVMDLTIITPLFLHLSPGGSTKLYTILRIHEVLSSADLMWGSMAIQIPSCTSRRSLSAAIMVRFSFRRSSDEKILFHLSFLIAFRLFAWQTLLSKHSRTAVQI